ncbi:olfactory receptor 6C74-like [Hemicordylus capensis]|uniref:olfactory receptor 6C74-like n=1 Tax=Hemicordylus capensis TaxID=884348 RepID=UPI002304963E|nr:olfactory receptor 6C74-like [Hemicordylus capensis]
MENQTVITDFILLDFPDLHQVEHLMGIILLTSYLLTLAGNIMIIIVVIHDHHLHTPMYFFLWNLSCLEILITSTVVPKVLVSLLLGFKTISRPACLSQCYFFFFLGTSDFALLAAMSYDRYIAICKPLHYAAIMSTQLCLWLVVGSYMAGFLDTIIPTILVANLPFCHTNHIDHFFCDSVALMKLACADTSIVELVSFLSSAISLLGSLMFTVVSYIYIVKTILQIPSASGRHKAFSTCSSHFIIVSLGYGSCIFMYVRPSGSNPSINKMVSLINTVLTPLLSPFIFTLRNQQMKDAVKAILVKRGIYSNKNFGIQVFQEKTRKQHE